ATRARSASGATTSSISPCASSVSERCTRGGSGRPVSSSTTRGPAKPTKAPGSAKVTVTSDPHAASTPTVVGCVSQTTYGSPAGQHGLVQSRRRAGLRQPVEVGLGVVEGERIVGGDVRVPLLEAALVGEERDPLVRARKLGLRTARHARIVDWRPPHASRFPL